MASALDPRDEQGMQQQAGPGLADQWRGFFQDPVNRAFMLQTGLALMQQPAFGQNLGSHVAGAIAQGGEAAGRVMTRESEQQEAESRQEARAANVEARQMHGEAALMSGQARLERAATDQQRRQMSEAPRVQAMIRGQNAFNTWLSNPLVDEKNDPYLAALGVKTRAEILTNPQLRARAIEMFTTQLPAGSMAPQAPMSPRQPGQNRTPIPGNSRIMGDAEGQAAGLYDDDEVSLARAAIARQPHRRRIIEEEFRRRTGRDPRELQ